MNQGKYVYSQPTDFLPKRVFDCNIDKYDVKHVVSLLSEINSEGWFLVNKEDERVFVI